MGLRLWHDALQPESVRHEGQESGKVPKEARQKGQDFQVQQKEVEQEEVQENLLRGRLLSRYALLIFEHPELPRACSRVTASRVSVRGADGGWHVLHACGCVFCHVLSYTVPIPANKVNRILLK